MLRAAAAVIFFHLVACLATYAQSPAAVTPVSDCPNLANADISTSVGAPAHITAASVVETNTPAPYCKVTGYVEPSIQFEVHLPTRNWTQRFVQTGCGGLCGTLNIRLSNARGCKPAKDGELVLASTDMGHSGGTDGSFGARDYQLRIDFAYRGVHLTTLAAKALINKYYGQAPRFSYFSGCSDGGREALMEAQRFPKDFDGISAGAPAMNFTTQNTFYHGWSALKNTGADGKPILTAAKLPLLHSTVIAQCDAQDGLKDGIISNPFACHPNLSALLCKPEQDSATCLSSAEIKVAQEVYSGAHDKDGGKLVLGGPLPGSELGWAGVFVPSAGQDRIMSATISTGTLQNLAYEKNPHAGYNLNELKFDRATFDATTRLHGLYDATDPDLKPFATAGGKLILWHGLADQHISPLNTIAYYTAMQHVLGQSAVDRFARLYLFPGGSHCGGGEGPFDVDLLTPLMQWVENGVAPNAIIASRLTRTRPIFSYPSTARYTGSGSIDEASNFVQGPPQPASTESLRWFGQTFFTPHYQTWCTASGATFNCSSATDRH